jgi:hypothetical protein
MKVNISSSLVLTLYERREIVMNDDSVTKENLDDTLNQIHNLLKLDADWNGHDSLAPKPDVVVHAQNWISRFFLVVAWIVV